MSGTTPTTDAHKMLNPTQKKLTNVESQRVMTVVHETTKKLEGALLLQHLSEHLDRFAVTMGTELVTKVQDYRSLCNTYERYCDHLSAEGVQLKVSQTRLSSTMRRSMPTLDPLDDTTDKMKERFQQVQYDLQQSAKTLLRAFYQCPSAETILNELRVECPVRVGHLVSDMTTLCNIMEKKLLTTHYEEVRQKDYVDTISEQCKEGESEILYLQRELEEAKRQRDEEVHQS